MSVTPKAPTVQAQEAEEEEELVDPQQTLRDSCNEEKSCITLQENYQACNDRVNSRSRTTEICNEELFDYLHCVEECVAKRLFTCLK